ncbi:MAG: metallophosphoesterase [Alphaproteobacteria bacterium]|nr:metallophosphoesterase [Alphaproteobacteria bacterium]
MISRRTFLKGFLALSATGASLGGYALAEPFRLRVSEYAVRPRNWPPGLRLKLAVIADLHVIEPWVGLERVKQIVARTNALSPDAVLLLGDYVPSSGMKRWAQRVGGSVVAADDWARELGKLRAPLGVHAVLGNHDWWEDPQAQARGAGPVEAGVALERAGISVYENDAVRLKKDGKPFWLAGLGDQVALVEHRQRREVREERAYRGVKELSHAPASVKAMIGDRRFSGVEDLAGMFAKVTDEAPVIMMAHEPDIFAEMGRFADRAALTISGHTHGGQVRLAGFALMVPSQYGTRYAYGHIVEDDRNLVVSGGLGCSGLPIRFGAPPEIVMIDVGDEAA